MPIYGDKPEGFDWDAGNRAKCQKYGVAIAQIELLLTGEVRIAPDLKHSDVEDRFIAIGRDSRGRPMFVAFVIREKDGERLFRPVSARYMHRKEVDGYEEKKSS